MNILEKRVGALEEISGDATERHVIVVGFHDPGYKHEEPTGIEAFGSLPKMDRNPGETWQEFVGRLKGLVSHMPMRCPLVLMARYGG